MKLIDLNQIRLFSRNFFEKDCMSLELYVAADATIKVFLVTRIYTYVLHHDYLYTHTFKLRHICLWIYRVYVQYMCSYELVDS